MRVTLLGTGDAFHGGGRGHAGVLVEDGRGRLLVDCGATVPAALERLGVGAAGIDAVVLTHLHGDHFAGLPFLYLSGMYAAPRGSLTVVGPPRSATRVEALFRALYAETADKRRPFFLDYREIEPDQAIDVGGRAVVAFRARHMKPPHVALSVRIESDGKVIALSADAGPTTELDRVADGADLFVCECTHPSSEAELAADAGHLSVADVARLRPGWRAKRVVLTHLSAAARVEAADLAEVEVGDDGWSVEL